jgi:ATP-binding cassette subfamily C protein
MAAAVSEHLGGMKTAKSHGWEAHHLAVFSRVVRDIASHWLTTARLQARSRAAYELGAVLALSAFLYCSVAVAHLSPAQVLLLAFIFTRLIPRMVAMQGNWHRVAQTLPSFEAAERLREEFIGAQEPAWPASPSRLVLSSDVTFEGVRFRYNDGGAREALDFTGIAIPAGGVTALCGPSGAGKSTFADLLLGLLRPAEGRILIDGKPLEGDRLHAWRQSVGYVPQETFLFHDTIRANLAMARPDASEADLGAALRAAAAADFVNRLPLGLDTVLGDRGIRLSGGERQRLALARALLRKPTMLVLDEATSSLDSQNEQLIQGALERLHGEMTVVIIAHRLSSVRFANQIVVLKEGSVAEMGKWEELCQREAGLFRQMASAGETA